MPWKNGEFYWTVEEKLADLLQGLYGIEHDEKADDLNMLIDAVRRDWAARLEVLVETHGRANGPGLRLAAEFLSPDRPNPNGAPDQV